MTTTIGARVSNVGKEAFYELLLTQGGIPLSLHHDVLSALVQLCEECGQKTEAELEKVAALVYTNTEVPIIHRLLIDQRQLSILAKTSSEKLASRIGPRPPRALLAVLATNTNPAACFFLHLNALKEMKRELKENLAARLGDITSNPAQAN